MALDSNSLFLRKAELLVGRKSGSSSKKEPTDAIRIRTRLSFEVEKTSQSTSNKAKISMYNVSQDTRNALEGDNVVAFLYAGYEFSTQLLFLGDVIKPITKRAGPDIITAIECGDAEKILQSATIEFVYSKPITNLTILNVVAKQLGVSTGTIPSNFETRIFDGLVFSGTAREILDRIVKQISYKWSIQDGVLQVVPVGGTTNDEAVVISPETGLLGFPTKTETGIEAVTLLNPEIYPGRAVKLRTKQISGALGGVFSTLGAETLSDAGGNHKVEKVVHVGDTHQGNWESRVEAASTDALVADVLGTSDLFTSGIA